MRFSTGWRGQGGRRLVCQPQQATQGRGWVEKGPRSCPTSGKVETYSSVEIQPCLLYSQSNGRCDCSNAQLWQVLLAVLWGISQARSLGAFYFGFLRAMLPLSLLHMQGPLGPGEWRCPPT